MALFRRFLTIGTWTLASRILGLVRDRLLGGVFGATLGLSAFMAAFQLPNLLRNLFGDGALSAAFVPRYVRLCASDPAVADGFAGLVLTRLAILLSLVAGAGMIVSAVLCLVLDVTNSTRLIVLLSLPQLPYMIFICVSAIMAGTLNGRHRFAIPAASPMILNLVLIATVLVFGRLLWVLPYAVLVTGMLQLGLHLIGLHCSGGVPRATAAARPHLIELRRALLPTLVASGAYQVNALLDTWIAFFYLQGSVPGAVTFLYFGNRLLQFPMALVTHAVGTAIYPDLAVGATTGWQVTGRSLRRSLELLLAVLLPAAVGMFLVAEPLVRVIYQTGAFDADAAGRTVAVVRFYVLALIPISCAKLLIRGCHAHLDQRTPMILGLGMVLVNLGLNLWLVTTPLEESGLALATAIAGWANCAVLLVVVARRGGGAVLGAFIRPWPLLASLAMGGAVWYLLRRWPMDPHRATWHHLGRLGALMGTGMAVYALVGGTHLRRLLRQDRTR